MSSFTGLFKRPRSKSEKVKTPPKVVFGDLGTAYASIAQKTTPSTPDLREKGAEGVSILSKPNAVWSSVQSPVSEASPSAPLLSQRSPEVIRVSRLSGDLFLPKDFDATPSKIRFSQAFDPFSSSHHDRSSFTPSDFKTDILDKYYGTSATRGVDICSEPDQNSSKHETKVLSSIEYPELKDAQLAACSKLSGVDQANIHDGQPLDRCGTVQSLSQRYPYGQVASNDDIRSFRGSHVGVEAMREGEEIKSAGAAVPDTIQEVEWSPRSSIDIFAPRKDNVHGSHGLNGPPSMLLPQTPEGKGIHRYGELQDFSSPTEQVSHSSNSYGNTRRLLGISSPQLPRLRAQGDSFFKNLIEFAKEGPSSSSRGDTEKSFATFSIEETRGNVFTRPVSQGEFQVLETAISSHLRRGSQASNADADFVSVGQISLRFPEGSAEDPGPGSSQTTTSSEFEGDVDYSGAQPALRTRNGTPPLLFGEFTRSKRDPDWETVGDTNDLSSSIADYSDSASRSPPKSTLFMNPGKVLKHPAHPRYNHSWDLQQDMRSGAYVLTPHYKISGGSSFPNNNGLAPLSLRNTPNDYSHPTPLTVDHSHPFATPAPQITSSESAGAIEQSRHDNINRASTLITKGSSGWTTTADPSSPIAGLPGTHDSSAAIQGPTLSSKNPFRPLKKLIYGEEIELPRIEKSQASPKSEDNGSKVEQAGSELDAAETAQRTSTKQRSDQTAAAFTDISKVTSSYGRQLGIFPEASSGALSVSSYATTNGGPRSTMSAAPRPFTLDADAFSMASPSDLDHAQVRVSDYRHVRSNSITQEQAEYLRARPTSWEPFDADLRNIIRPLPRPDAHRTSRLEPYPFAPEPHPVSHADFPHLVPCLAAARTPQTYQHRIARYYLGICGLLFPVLLPLYIFGWLDIVMRLHTSGRYRGFPDREKRIAVGVLIGWLILFACVVPVIAVSRSAWWGEEDDDGGRW